MSAVNAHARLRKVGLAIFMVAAGSLPAHGQWVQENEQFYYPASHNWVFRQNYVGVDRLFNAFDYGHAILYEELYTRPGGPVERLEEREYTFLTERLLKRPPRVPLEEGAVEIAYAKLAPEAKLMFEWAHLLHRQIYDVLADERLSDARKDEEVARLLAYYRSRPDLAFSSRPKSMELMDGQYYSLAFRERYPKFNGLIWAYHWLQVGLYEPLLVNGDVTSRTAGVTATVGRFWQMLGDGPDTMPYLMPMTAAIAPVFAERYQEAAIIFDNLHMMHDVISDVLASPLVPRDQKRAEILKAAAFFRDDTSFVIPVAEWASMGDLMGVHNMGGPAVGFTAALPEPTVVRGASMAGADHSQHAAPQPTAAAPTTPGDHAAHEPTPGAADDAPQAPDRHSELMHEMHLRMMADPVIRERIESDPLLRQMVEEMGMMMMADGASTPAGTLLDASPAALDFIVRLLTDPAVEARIHSDPRLHQLWSDPAVQQRLRELREDSPAAPAAPAAPAPEPAPAHQH